MRGYRVLIFAILGALAAGCTLIEFDQLIPSSAISELTQDVGAPVVIFPCQPPGSPQAKGLAEQRSAKHLTILGNITNVQSKLPPQLVQDPVVQSVLGHVIHASTNSTLEVHRLLGQAPTSIMEVVATSPKPIPITNADFFAFTQKISEFVLRHTISAASDTGDVGDKFWVNLKQYYLAYYRGTFVDYFSRTVSGPKSTLTIDDTEISEIASVFLELLLDQALDPTVWCDHCGLDDTKKTFYPGGVTGAKPTYLVVNNIDPQPFSSPTSYGCGMTKTKADTVNYLARTFGTAATTETSLAVKTAGGLEVGLGIFGKINIGDNNTLTSLLNAAVGEVVKRLTVAFTVPILEAVDVEPAAPRSATIVRRSTQYANVNRAQMIRLYSAPFVSAAGRSRLRCTGFFCLGGSL